MNRRYFLKALTSSAVVVGAAAMTVPQAVHASLLQQSVSRHYGVPAEDPEFVPLRTRYVSTTGSSSNNGASLETAWTLAYAVTQAIKGDLILIADGEYSDTTNYGSNNWMLAFNTSNSGTAEDPIVFRSINHLGAKIVGAVKSGSNRCPAVGILDRKNIWWERCDLVGTAKIRGTDGNPPSYTAEGCRFRYCRISGDFEGTDGSLNWGGSFQFAKACIFEHCVVTGMVVPSGAGENNGYTGDNSACIDIFKSIECIVRNCDLDATNVNACVALKAGQCHDNLIYNNFFRNVRSGFGGTAGTCVYMKANTAETDFCDRNKIYNNVGIDAYEFVFFNHNCRETQVYNNTAYNCDRFMRQWKTSNTSTQYWNNLHIDNSPQYRYFIEAFGGGGISESSDVSPYIDYSDFNCWVGQTSTFARWADGSISLSLSTWRSVQTGVDGHDMNSLSPSNATGLLVDPDNEDFRPAGSLIGAGRFGDNIGCDGINIGVQMAHAANADWFREVMAA